MLHSLHFTLHQEGEGPAAHGWDGHWSVGGEKLHCTSLVLYTLLLLLSLLLLLFLFLFCHIKLSLSEPTKFSFCLFVVVVIV